jgi:photosystem II stability/assembly factor-like uncharacterized protein
MSPKRSKITSHRVIKFGILLCILAITFPISSSGQDFWIRSGLDSSDVEILSGGPDSSLYAGIFQPGVPGKSTIYRSTDNGASWRELNSGLPSYISANDFIFSPTYAYTAADTGLYRVRDRDTTWAKVFSDGTFISSVANNSSGLMFIGTGAVYRSADSGETWQRTYLAVDTTAREPGSVRSLAISKTGNIIASVRTFHAFTWIARSTDSGFTWSTIGFGSYVDQMAVNPMSGSLFGVQNSGFYGLFRSTDEGITWAIRDSSLNGDRFSSLAFDATGKLYAGGNGVFVSSDEGADWLNITHNLPSPPLAHALTLGADGHLYVGTVKSGVWKSAQSVTSAADEYLSNYPREFILYQNYPNPFNPRTSIGYRLPSRSYVTLKVFDLLGCEVATIVNGRKESGEHSVTWNAGNLPSGIYYYRLTAGTLVETKKMVVTR